MSDSMTPLLRIQSLQTSFATEGAPVRAVDGVDLGIERGQTYALLGESGCGKSMTALSVMKDVLSEAADRARR